MGMFLRFALQYPKIYREIIEIEHEALGLEKDENGFLLRPDDTQTARHDPRVQRLIENPTTKTADKTLHMQENPLQKGVAAKVEEMHNEQQGGDGRNIKLRRRLPIGQWLAWHSGVK